SPDGTRAFFVERKLDEKSGRSAFEGDVFDLSKRKKVSSVREIGSRFAHESNFLFSRTGEYFLFAPGLVVGKGNAETGHSVFRLKDGEKVAELVEVPGFRPNACWSSAGNILLNVVALPDSTSKRQAQLEIWDLEKRTTVAKFHAFADRSAFRAALNSVSNE